nr:WD repeat-containing protein 74-like [Dromaius novaehollandiae]
MRRYRPSLMPVTEWFPLRLVAGGFCGGGFLPQGRGCETPPSCRPLLRDSPPPGVNLQRKQATNYTSAGSLSRAQGVCTLCWGDVAESEVLVGCLDRAVKLFSTEKGKFTATRLCPGGQGPFCGLAVHGSALITCVESGLLKVWREDDAENLELQAGAGLCRMRQDPARPQRVATGGRDNGLKVWDLQRPQEPLFRAKNVRNDWLNLHVPIWDRDLQFLPGSDKIVTCTGHHQVRLYDPSSPQRRPVLETTFGEHPLTTLSLAPGANSVVVGSARGDLAVIDLRQGRLLRCLKGVAGGVRGLQCHPHRPLVASCGLDRFLRVHGLGDKRPQHKVRRDPRRVPPDPHPPSPPFSAPSGCRSLAVAKRKSLFDDKAVEIEELTYIIKQDINSLNKQIAQLQDVVRAKGSQSGRHVQTHSNTVVVSLQSKLASMSNDFKSVLEVRTENLKQQRSRREHFSRAPVSALPLAAGNLGGSAVLQDEAPRARDVAIDMDARTSQQLQLINEQDSYIQSRADTMQNIESTIVELGSIFQQLAHMVKEQEETIQR